MPEQRPLIRWIEGLRAIACLCIFAHHFFSAFYPVTLYGTALADASPQALVLVQSPFSVVLNGNFWVCVFCMIAGFVASCPYFLAPKSEQALSRFSGSLILRYFRLCLPVFGMCERKLFLHLQKLFHANT